MATRRRASRNSLTGAVGDLQRRVRYLQNRPNVTSLANEVVVRSKIQPRAVSTDQLELAAVTNDQVAADAIKREQIFVGAVGTSEIDGGAVTTEKLNNEAVTTDKLGNNSVAEGKIINEAVTNSKIGSFAVNNAKLSDAAIERRNMTPNSVENSSLRTDSVSFRTVAPNAIGNENLLGDSVGNDEVQGNAISQNNMQSDSVGFGEMQSSSVGNSTLQNGAVTDNKIGGTVSGSKIGSGFDGENIKVGSISGSAIAQNTIGTRQLSSNAYPAIVASGLRASFGISKRGATISVDSGDLQQIFASSSHRHEYQAFAGTALTSRPVSSSAQVKKNVATYETVDPKNLLKLELKKFKYKRSHSGYHRSSNREWMHGYIIEDLLSLGFDEAVHYNKKGEPEKLDYGLMSALVLELVKVQQQEIESLQDKVKRLEEK